MAKRLKIVLSRFCDTFSINIKDNYTYTRDPKFPTLLLSAVSLKVIFYNKKYFHNKNDSSIKRNA